MSSSKAESYKIEYFMMLYVVDTICESICLGFLLLAKNVIPEFPKKVITGHCLRLAVSTAMVLNLIFIGPLPATKWMGYLNFVPCVLILFEPNMTAPRTRYSRHHDRGYYNDMLKNSFIWPRFVIALTVLMVCLKRMVFNKMELWIVMQPAVFLSMIFFFFSVIMIFGFLIALLFGICNCYRSWSNYSKF
jgi:hypothetical protein